jgi:hypothetical protein
MDDGDGPITSLDATSAAALSGLWRNAPMGRLVSDWIRL